MRAKREGSKITIGVNRNSAGYRRIHNALDGNLFEPVILEDDDELNQKKHHENENLEAEQKRKTDKWRKIKYIATQAAFLILTVLCCIGIASLAFFFVHQFDLVHHLTNILNWTVAPLIAGIIFTGYFFLFTISAYKGNKKAYERAIKEAAEKDKVLTYDEKIPREKKILIEASKQLTAWDNKFPESPEESEQRAILDKYLTKKAKENVSKDKRKSKLQLFLMIANVAIGALAVVFLGGGNYLGLMDIGTYLNAASGFQPLAIMSGVAMFITMFSYFLPDLKKNAAALPKAAKKSFKRLKERKAAKAQQNNQALINHNNEDQQRKKSKTAKAIKGLYCFLAVFSAVGFASFKLYSTTHVMPLMGVTSATAIGAAGAIAFVSMIFMCLTTSTVSMWKFAEEKSLLYDKKQELKELLKEHPNEEEKNEKRGWGKIFNMYNFAWLITFLTAAFNGAGSFIGMVSASAIYPPLLPLFIIIGVVAGIARFAEIAIYYGPVIAENMSGIPSEKSSPEFQLVELNIKIATIKAKYAAQNDLASDNVDDFELGVINEEDNLLSGNFSSPTGGTKTLLGRKSGGDEVENLEKDKTFNGNLALEF